MKQLLLRFQLLIVSVVLLATFAMLFPIVRHYNRRWDLTSEKLYTLATATQSLLDRMKDSKIDVIAFYPSQDNITEDFEIFLKECALYHKDFHYAIYHPNRRPQLAKSLNVREYYTVILRYKDREERVVLPSEETFDDALLRLLEPRTVATCILIEPGDQRIFADGPEGFSVFKHFLEDLHYPVHEVPLETSRIPAFCEVLIVPGPQSDWKEQEMNLVKNAFNQSSILFLIDPMDAGSGLIFSEFLAPYHIELGKNVVIDKSNPIKNTDFLLTVAEKFAKDHPLVKRLRQGAVFPVVRSVHAVKKENSDYEASEIVFSNLNSWGESDLMGLETGDSVFDKERDTAGPLPLIAATHKVIPSPASAGEPGKPDRGERLAVVGDSDFLTNGYFSIGSNRSLAAAMLRWLARDERLVELSFNLSQFEPLLFSKQKRLVLLVLVIGIYPFLFLMIGALQNIIRKRFA